MYNLSVIIPVYNVQQYIGRCLDSILNQTMQDGVELIIVNDCTPDNSMHIVKEKIERYKGNIDVKIIFHESNKGIAEVRNTGLVAATGKYIIYIDSDDYCENDMFAKMYEKGCQDNADIVLCDFFYENGNRKINYEYEEVSKDVFFYNILSGKSPSYLWCRMIKRRIYVDNKIKFISGINMLEDLVVSIPLHFFAASISFVHEVLYHYVKNETSIVQTIKDWQIQNELAAMQAIEMFLKSNGIYEKYKIPFLQRTLIIKGDSLFLPATRNYKYWKSVYPESHTYIKQFDLSWHTRWIQRLAICGIPQVAIVLFNIRKWITEKYIR